MPSIEMASAPFGRPFTEDVLGLPGVVVPGSASTRSRASRDAVGISVICRPVRVDPTVAFSVLRSSPPPVTVICSDGAPSSIWTLIDEGVPTFTLISVTIAFLNPWPVIVAVYVPELREGTRKYPSSFVPTVISCLVASLVMTTVAPATTALLGSSTVPETEPVDPPCPTLIDSKISNATAIEQKLNSSRRNLSRKTLFISFPPEAVCIHLYKVQGIKTALGKGGPIRINVQI